MNEYIKTLIAEMIDGGTLPRLNSEEIDELARKSQDGLVPYILEVFEY